MIIVADGKYFQSYFMTYNMMMYDLFRIDFDV